MQASQENLHQDDRAVWDRLVAHAAALADRYKLHVQTVEPKRRPHPGGHTGICYVDEARIAIVLRFREGKRWFAHPREYTQIRATLAHELAHLVAGCNNHSDLFYQFEEEFLKFIKQNERNLGPMPKQTSAKKYSSVARTLDRIADAAGVGAEHVAASPRLLAGAGLEPEDIDQETVFEAKALHREKMSEIRQRAVLINGE